MSSRYKTTKYEMVLNVTTRQFKSTRLEIDKPFKLKQTIDKDELI